MTHFQQLTKSRPSRDGFFCGIQRRDRLDAIPPFPSAGNLADKSIIPGAIFLCSAHANLHSKRKDRTLYLSNAGSPSASKMPANGREKKKPALL